ncbi:MAG: hypothetical protein ABIP63_05280 [Thermoanaerobaculia bacterium]
MQAFGSDRVRPPEKNEKNGESGDNDYNGENGQQLLLSRLPKGWTPRTPKTLTTAEFPGTAVLWDGAYYQVLEATALPQGGVQYLLEPWPDQHAIRVSDRYDAESEEARVLEWRRRLSQEKRRKSASLLAILTGHLPETIQEHLGRELGLSAPRMTQLSAFGTWLIAGGLAMWIGEGTINQTPRPAWVLVVAGYLFLESTIRFFAAFASGAAMGSPMGTMSYIAWYVALGRSRGARSPFSQEKGRSIKTTAATPEQAELDAFTMRESLATLLPRADQERIAARYPYEYRRNGSIIAVIILGFSLIGVFSSFHKGEKLSLLVAAALSAEQIWRLLAFRSHPAGSVLGFLVRPFMRKLLS